MGNIDLSMANSRFCPFFSNLFPAYKGQFLFALPFISFFSVFPFWTLVFIAAISWQSLSSSPECSQQPRGEVQVFGHWHCAGCRSFQSQLFSWWSTLPISLSALLRAVLAVLSAEQEAPEAPLILLPRHVHTPATFVCLPSAFSRSWAVPAVTQPRQAASTALTHLALPGDWGTAFLLLVCS